MPKYVDHKCLTCDVVFKGPKKSAYLCEEKSEGQLHDVPVKTYYAPTKGLTIHYSKEVRGLDAQGAQVILDAGSDAVFNNGVFQTTNPKAQDFLEGYSGLISFAEWERVHVPQAERVKKIERESAQKAVELENANVLIAQLQEQLAAKSKPAAK